MRFPFRRKPEHLTFLWEDEQVSRGGWRRRRMHYGSSKATIALSGVVGFVAGVGVMLAVNMGMV